MPEYLARSELIERLKQTPAMGLVVRRSGAYHQAPTFEPNMGIVRLLNRQPILSTQQKMRLAGNEPAFRCDLWPLGNRINLSEYPSALPARSALNFVDFLTRRRKNSDFARRPNVDPESTPIRAKELRDDPTLTPANFDMLACQATGHSRPH
ncbi:hypothetical protein V5F50_07985 [Xanthobacter sp. V13C-7B]